MAHVLFLAGDMLWTRPFSPLFAGDAFYFLEQARYLTLGEHLGSQLPFHPPGTSWLLVPLWWVLGDPAMVFAASKVLMAVLSGLTTSLFFVLIRDRLPLALPICLLLPLGFGELLLSSAPNAEIPYRLLLLAVIALGFRWPVLGGMIHGVAALFRAEHLILGAGAAAFALFIRGRRTFVAFSFVGASLVLLPYALWTAGTIHAYNQEHQDELVDPLPVVVPVSFYGPLNFALAQKEDDIFFSRLSLPIAQEDPRSLLPTDPAHNRFIVHGVAVGLEEIGARPLRFLKRTLRRLGHSFRAVGQGWTWRDLPKPAFWIRRPVDLSYSPGLVYEILALILAAAGIWVLRRERIFLALGLALLVFRLGMNALFFPYLRGMAICSPFFFYLFFSGSTLLFKKHTERVLLALFMVLALFHLSTAWKLRNYRLDGERDGDGRIIDDRTVELEFRGFIDRR
jgi:hypothetical protein